MQLSIKIALDTSTAGFGFDLGIEAETSVSIEDESVASFEGRLPSLIKIFWNVNDDTKRYREFFRENRGALAITEAQCITHKVRISIHNCLANYFWMNNRYIAYIVFIVINTAILL